MKNKTPLFIGLAVLAVIIGGAFFMMRGGATSPLSQGSSPADLVTNALTGSGSMKCEYTDEEGRNIVAYVKGGNIRSDVTGGPEGNASFIMKDKTMWTWDQTKKEGMMMTFPEVTGTPENAEETTQPESSEQTAEEMKAELEEYKENCKNESVDNSLFEVPTDVTFQDYSKMMQDAMQQVPEEYKQYMPQQ